MQGERLEGTTYDGKTEIALFPGTCPNDPIHCSRMARLVAINFLRFTPPRRLERNAVGDVVLPHIRFDRALDYLLGDRLA